MLVIANFKQNLTTKDIQAYFENWQELTKDFKPNKNLKIVFCPAFVHLGLVKNFITNVKNTYCGSQDVSPFNYGSYTGEVGAQQIKDFCKFTIIGHSERRKYFKEDNWIKEKVKRSLEENIIPIVCISKKEQVLKNIKVVYAYEPIENIGTGKPASLDRIKKFLESISKLDRIVIYGGSVNSQNVKSLLEVKNLKGFLVGGASLNPKEFFKIVEIVNNYLDA